MRQTHFWTPHGLSIKTLVITSKFVTCKMLFLRALQTVTGFCTYPEHGLGTARTWREGEATRDEGQICRFFTESIIGVRMFTCGLVHPLFIASQLNRIFRAKLPTHVAPGTATLDKTYRSSEDGIRAVRYGGAAVKVRLYKRAREWLAVRSDRASKLTATIGGTRWCRFW